MGEGKDVIIVGAGILGLATAHHMLQREHDIDLLVVDRLGGPGRGATARSAAAYRDMFTSPINRRLAAGSIAFYEGSPARASKVGLRRIGYLWLMTGEKITRTRHALEYLSTSGSVFEVISAGELEDHLPGLEAGEVERGVLGVNCGILNQNLLSSFYEREVRRQGGSILYREEVTGFLREGSGEIGGIRLGERGIGAGKVVVATGAWMGETMALADREVPVTPVKRQLFSIRTRKEVHRKLLKARGLNSHDLMPFTILPSGAYMRPAANSIIVGYADDRDETYPGEPAEAEGDFFEDQVRPRISAHFPSFGEVEADHMWAGYYAVHRPDHTPFVHEMDGALLVGGASGSGVMKADSIGRVAAGRAMGRAEVELGDGTFLRVDELDLEGRDHPEEEFVI